MGRPGDAQEMANTALERWRETGVIPETLREQRCCLFFEQRRWHHFGHGFDEETMKYARALVAAMRAALGGA